MKLTAFDLEKNRIYIGSIHKKPVKFMGMMYDMETNSKPDEGLSVIWQFEYVLPQHLPGPKGGVAGYGQTRTQVDVECYTVAKSLDLLYGPK